jgi:hypothetical protein
VNGGPVRFGRATALFGSIQRFFEYRYDIVRFDQVQDGGDFRFDMKFDVLSNDLESNIQVSVICL